MRFLVTGGAGFVGSSLARRIKREDPGRDVVVLDNLRRRGAALNVPLLAERGVEFVHGDIRMPADLEDLPGRFDVLIEASAEPSVLAGLDGSPAYVLQTNLAGTLNCLEFARRRAGCFVFLSTSRVYSIEPLRRVPLEERETRFAIAADAALGPGLSQEGMAEGFPTHEARSLYGASKLGSEMVVQEYAGTYGLKAVINRCGVIAGPGQFGTAGQGVITYWLASHYFGKPLAYTGFGGQGKQVRDVLHPADLYELIRLQLERIDDVSGETFNVGGGREISVSLLELTQMCREVTGREVRVASDPRTTPVDIPLYYSDCRKVRERLGWTPHHSVERVLTDVLRWITDDETVARSLFA